jgi:hypothetical protein
MTEILSPAAQAVRNAALISMFHEQFADYVAAAVIRAVADQVVPETKTPWNSTLTPILSATDMRSRLLAIATELEEQP